MDIRLFLQLPVDIRCLVYFQLDGEFTLAGPQCIEKLYAAETVQVLTGLYKRTKYQKLIHKELYHWFSQYLDIFEYSPALIDKWLEYSLWLRYDGIVLDSLRLNHVYGGELLGQIDCVELGNKLRLAYFKDSMIQLWYTYREYVRWIANIGTEMDIDYVRVNLENYTSAKLDTLLHDLKQNEMLPFINCILLEDEKEDDLSMKYHQDLDEDSPYQLTDVSVISIIKNMESMKNLIEIGVRGYHLYETLINMHGVRDNPGKTINYIVRSRIKKINLTQIPKLGLCDLTRWENLRELTLINVQEINLNMLVIPSKCQVLNVRKVNTLNWWLLLDAIEARIQENHFQKWKNDSPYGYTTLKRINNSSIDDLDKIEECKTLVFNALGSLNLIRIQDVQQIKGNKIVVPSNLYDNKRILLHGTTMRTVKEIIVV
ncbi:hypothetical protein HG535_0D03280 [Zygotorulaspora mrakii]|uniref:Uncharacterized protein n=1 Tax=Zygotorulaspora mrakii TaxID=42260 RepID=A0A7H9B1X1_ZYGMR|nr:uncharacterized protein HG535_0D03280 [Zygotorulaspora mrakii]QLG72620.1 hypothetical protein HG535_0D03280 [Zygotorulaspora mrakii]